MKSSQFWLQCINLLHRVGFGFRWEKRGAAARARNQCGTVGEGSAATLVTRVSTRVSTRVTRVTPTWWFLAAARIMAGPPMSMFSTPSANGGGGSRVTVARNGYRLTTTWGPARGRGGWLGSSRGGQGGEGFRACEMLGRPSPAPCAQPAHAATCCGAASGGQKTPSARRLPKPRRPLLRPPPRGPLPAAPRKRCRGPRPTKPAPTRSMVLMPCFSSAPMCCALSRIARIPPCTPGCSVFTRPGGGAGCGSHGVGWGGGWERGGWPAWHGDVKGQAGLAAMHGVECGLMVH
jgi:hypothetical protein